jgi:hypothetical protein
MKDLAHCPSVLTCATGEATTAQVSTCARPLVC